MSELLKAVLVGCGGISRAWLDAVRQIPDLALVGLVDLNEAAARHRATEYGWNEALVSTDLTTTLKKTCPDIVFDCTVPAAHVQVTLTALAHGCHVLGEKPLADSMDNARRMVAAARGRAARVASRMAARSSARMPASGLASCAGYRSRMPIGSDLPSS